MTADLQYHNAMTAFCSSFKVADKVAINSNVVVASKAVFTLMHHASNRSIQAKDIVVEMRGRL